MAYRTIRLAAAGVGLALAASTAQAQILTFDFGASDGGWTAQTLSGSQNWFWDAGNAGWRVNNSTAVGQTRLLSPLLRITDGSFAITLRHRYNFEGGQGTCFDGGNWKAALDGSNDFFYGNFDTGGYIGTISSSFANPMAGEGAWCAQSIGWNTGAFVTAQTSGSVNAGLLVQFAFDAAWDNSVQADAPNWEIASIELRGFEVVQVVPEPSTYALLATGLVALGLAARRRRA